MNLEQEMAEAYVRSLIPDVVILPSSTSDAYDNQEDHMKALEFHKALGQVKEMAKSYGLEIKVQNAKNL
ncbi:MAG: hypothetical protein RLZZ196_771 [Bacteroidota bacterium]|jgi:hypothetical protein